MDYAKTCPHHGNRTAIVEEIRRQLGGQGFRIERRAGNELAMTGPGMHSSEQSALLGMSRIEVNVTSSEILFQADLGGVRFLQRFVTLFPFVLGGGMFLLFTFLASHGRVVWAPLAAVAPWLVVGPWLAMRFKRRTVKAIDALLHNAIMVGETQPSPPASLDLAARGGAEPLPERPGDHENLDGWDV